MSDLRTAAQQALEALEAGLDVNPILAGEAEEALRAALAQQDEPAQEPVAWTVTFHGVVTEQFQDKEEAENFYRAMQANYPQDATHRKLIPLYTAPPQRKLVLLTEEKKRALADKFLSCQPESYEVSGVFDLISAVERAHGIKE